MIKRDCFQKEWIDSFRAQEKYSKINPPLLEKMIHALSLLQFLEVHRLNFVFKGGTSLILLMENLNRFSVAGNTLLAPISVHLNDQLFFVK